MFDYLSKINISRASLTPLGRVFKIRDFLCMSLSDFVVVDRDILTPK